MCAAPLLLAVALRLYHLQRYVMHGDEGVYLESLQLMQRGFLPFRDFFSSQGPLFLPLLYPFSLIDPVLGPRLGVVLLSLLGMLAVADLARRGAGVVAALAAALVLGLSPIFLATSRLGLAEVPAAALAAVALWLASRAPRRRWLAAAGAVLAAALLVKPMVAPAGFAVLALAAAARLPTRSWHALALDLAVVAAGGLAVLVLGTAPFGPADVFDQFVRFHVQLSQLSITQDPDADTAWQNIAFAGPVLGREGVGLYALGALGLARAVAGRRRLDCAAALWLAGTVALLWFYSPFYGRYLSLLLPPLALLAAGAVAAASTRVRAWTALAGVAGLAYFLSLPGVLAADLAIAETPWTKPRLQEVRAAAELAAATAPGEFVATDNQRIAILAGRLVAPPLVDTSAARVKTGSLGTADVIRAVEQYRVNAVVWWFDTRFGKLDGLKEELLGARFTLTGHHDPGDEEGFYLRAD